ncbi:Plasmodium exported protein, unknown function [Plasmodium sp. gorilla clade G2]|uniref:Plasmodium exported protein, unknown function n=1 Tax=Plasmodium sp. gorilla clade G2 TaxID=880535 RepID=UPI000D21355B|nr:Plasmodium exported protein, unknown function [Plasmodium sp. gorilla clade G2]SOV11994.1 Plasmodium exported protein, unknown function [Plasmodium sp. gorilla clade G2]
MNINISFINIFNLFIFIIFLHYYNKIASKTFCNDVKYLNEIKLSKGSYRSLSDDMVGMAMETCILWKTNSSPYAVEYEKINDDEELSNQEKVSHKKLIYRIEKINELYQNENEINKMNSVNVNENNNNKKKKKFKKKKNKDL